MTTKQLSMSTGASEKTANLFMPYILETFEKYQINTPIRQLTFLAQVGHESARLFYTEELASGDAYEGRKDLGNTHPGDGRRYKGRGLIQITGRSNYTTLGQAFNVNLIDHPELLGAKNATKCSPEQLRYATLSAGWYWNSRNLNITADVMDIHSPIDSPLNAAAYRMITKKINGGTIGLFDRIERYKAGLPYFT